ncbi:unnamed protein product [Urochloa decumbens]|uniref:Uncharacterized protein n=1 Tax=Urochloa decumbens TaxID=240449 RepID=A0ABC8ZP13_9POAL
MKLLVDTKAGRVLYAEAGKEVVDFLFSLLSLPLGTVTKLLTAGAGAGVAGSASSSPPPDDAAAKLPTTGAMVGSVGNLHRSVAALDARHAKMATEVKLVLPDGGAATPPPAAGEGSSGGGSVVGYVRDMVTYTVMDDLTVAPMSTIGAVTAIAALGVTDITGLQAKTAEIGYKEGLALLRASLQPETVLTDVFLGGKQSSGARAADLGSRSPYKFRGTF